MSITLTAEQKNIMERHPCFNGDVHDQVGRVHLPVAPRCNIQCNYCERDGCANITIQHPGWSARILSVTEAVELVRSIIQSEAKKDFVVGVAGPGDPLANDDTFKVLELLHLEYPELLKCISTNGLLLEDRLPRLLKTRVKAITVTINACNSSIGKNVYSWAKYAGTICREEEAAMMLIEKQFAGVEKALNAGLLVKINTVLIPGVNDRHLVKLAARLREAGVTLMNIMPLVPSGKLKDNRAPTCDELQRIRRDCEEFIPQFYHCKQCRADVIFTP